MGAIGEEAILHPTLYPIGPGLFPIALAHWCSSNEEKYVSWYNLFLYSSVSFTKNVVVSPIFDLTSCTHKFKLLHGSATNLHACGCTLVPHAQMCRVYRISKGRNQRSKLPFLNLWVGIISALIRVYFTQFQRSIPGNFKDKLHIIVCIFVLIIEAREGQ